jgi:hypothetical protein
MRGVTVNTVSASAFDRRHQRVLLDIEMSLDAASELGKGGCRGLPPPCANVGR